MSTKPSKDEAGKQRGAPKGNRYALRHGLRGGQMPADAKHLENRINKFRRSLEDRVLELRGSITLAEAAIVQTCLRWERHAALAQRWLTLQGDELTPDDRLKFSREIARASSERDKAIAQLRIDTDKRKDQLDALYNTEPEDGSA